MEVIESFDLGTWNFFQTHHLPAVDLLMLGLGGLGNPAVLLLILLAGAALAFWRRQVSSVLFLVASFAGAYGLLLLTAQLVARERPQLLDPLVAEPFWQAVFVEPATLGSFPSGRTLLATATFLSIGLVARAGGRGRLFWLSAALAFFVGFGCIYMGTCFPTDVFAGWLGGTGWVLWCRRTQERWLSRGAARPEASSSPSQSAASRVA